MTIIIETIEKRPYELLGNLDNEESVLEDFFNYSGGTYICDAIMEIADGGIPIYNGDVWAGASDISEYIEQAIEEGIAPTQGRDVDLIRIFQSGYYQFYSQSLYDNLETLCFNYVADKVNEFIGNLEEEEVANLDVSEIEDAIGEAVGDIDNNDYFSALEDVANAINDRISDGEFES